MGKRPLRGMDELLGMLHRSGGEHHQRRKVLHAHRMDDVVRRTQLEKHIGMEDVDRSCECQPRVSDCSFAPVSRLRFRLAGELDGDGRRRTSDSRLGSPRG